MAKMDKFSELAEAIEEGCENLKKWYWAIDKNDAYFVCLGLCPYNHCLLGNTDTSAVLDPNTKAAYFEDRWDSKYFSNAMVRLRAVVCPPYLLSTVRVY